MKIRVIRWEAEIIGVYNLIGNDELLIFVLSNFSDQLGPILWI